MEGPAPVTSDNNLPVEQLCALESIARLLRGQQRTILRGIVTTMLRLVLVRLLVVEVSPLKDRIEAIAEDTKLP